MRDRDRQASARKELSRNASCRPPAHHRLQQDARRPSGPRGTLLGWYVVVLGIRDSATMRIEVPELVRNVTFAMFIIAGVARLASWRMTRDWDAAVVAVTLLAVGTALPAASLLATVFNDGAVAQIEAPEGDILVLIPVCFLALFLGSAQPATAGGNRRDHDRHLRCHRGARGGTTRFARLRSTHDRPVGRSRGHDHVRLDRLGVSHWARRRVGGENAILSWAVFAALLMAGRAVLRLWSLIDVSTLHGLGGGLGLCAAAIMLTNAVRMLHTQIRQRIVDDELGRDLLVRNDRIDELEQAQRARLHDARSVVLGVKGASALLACDADMPADLDAVIAAELDRLHELLEADAAPRPCVEFDVRDALLPVLTTHRLAGARIHASIGSITAVGRATATATVVDNLLRNAARHAPGASVHVSVSRHGDEIEILVEDDGPGIPAHNRTQVLLPGVRGADAPAGGHGLGLYNSTCAMAAQDGSLRITGRPHGGTRIVLGLPAAMCAAPAARIAS